MKRFNFTMAVAVVGLGLALLVGCGGGGGGSSAPATAQLSPQNIDSLIQRVSDEVGCSYTPTAKAPLLRNSLENFLPLGAVMENFSEYAQLKGITKESKLRTSLRKSETKNGNCGGTEVSVLNDSGKNNTVTFNHYCVRNENGLQTITDGKFLFSTTVKGEATTIAFSTPNPIHVQSTNPNTNKNVDSIFNIVGGSYYSSKGGLSPDLKDQSTELTLKVKLVTIQDKVTNNSYKFENITVSVNSSGSTFSLYYTDPELGKIELSSNGDIQSKDGTIVITGSHGEKAYVSSSDTDKVFNVRSDDASLGVMDCQMINLPQ